MWNRLVLVSLLVSMLSACSSERGADNEDTSQQEQDATQAQDLIADRGPEQDPQPTDTQPADSPTPDTTQEDADPYTDLPALPPDMSFTTRYAGGAAGAAIDPEEIVLLGGFGMCGGKPEACRYSEGIHDSLMVTAAAIADTETGEVVIFIGVDAVGLLRWDIDLVHQAAPAAFAERFGVRMDGPRLVIGASHSHHAPDTVGLWGPMDGDVRDEEPYIEMMRATILETALDAFEDLGDVELDWGQTTAPNHDEDDFADDEDVFVLRGRRPEGEPVFTLTRWACHTTTYGMENNGISSDYVSPFRLRMQELLGGVPVFINGAIGSVYADTPEPCDEDDPFPEGYQDPDLTPEKDARVACVGYNLAESAAASLEAGQPVAGTGLRFRHAHFEFNPTNVLLSLMISQTPIPIDVPDLMEEPGAMMTSQFSWITLGDLDYMTTPGESFPHFAMKTKERMAAAGIEHPIVLGLTQDWMGYLMTIENYDDPDLDYYRSLCPGEKLEAAFIDAVDALLASD